VRQSYPKDAKSGGERKLCISLYFPCMPPADHGSPLTRRDFVGRAARYAMALSPAPAVSHAAPIELTESGTQIASRGFLNLRRAPDLVMVQTAALQQTLSREPNGRWSGGGATVSTFVLPGTLRVTLSAPTTAVERMHLRWRGGMSDARLLLGDAWERGYGDLEWRGWAPDRMMPWYAATYDGARTHAYGVRPGANAFCFWQLDAKGISLWADVRSGGLGVQVGECVLDVCDVMCRAGRAGPRRLHQRGLGSYGYSPGTSLTE
jgi:alpha-galactosidase